MVEMLSMVPVGMHCMATVDRPLTVTVGCALAFEGEVALDDGTCRLFQTHTKSSSQKIDKHTPLPSKDSQVS